MAAIGARGSASVYSIGGDYMNPDGGNQISLSTPAGWHFGWWGLAVALILFFLWAL